METQYPPPAWMDEGFSAPPEMKESCSGGVEVYRAFGGTSWKLSNCFFVPSVAGLIINHCTAEQLELELNASLWGNDYEVVRKFRIKENLSYKLGPVAHDSYVGHEKSLPFFQRSFITPSGLFKQVKIIVPEGKSLEGCIDQLGDVCKPKPGNYVRGGPSSWQ